MKHQLTGAFVLAALTAPLAAQAEGKIYGVFHATANQVESDIANANRTADGASAQTARFGSQVQDGQSADNNASRIGIQGEKGQFFFAVELGLDIDSDADGANGLASTRHAFVGFNSSYGTFTFGRVNTAYKLAAQRLDPFYDTSAANFVGGFSPEGATYGLSNLVNGWTDNTIAYLSPEVGGLTVNAGIHLQEADDADHDYSIGLDYRLGDITVGLQFLDIGRSAGEFANGVTGVVAGSEGVVDTAGQINAHYAGDGWTVGASYEYVELLTIDDERGYAYLAGTYDLGENLTLAASAGQVDQGAGEGFGGTIGAFVNLMPEFQIYGLYSYTDLDQANLADGTVASDENNTISFGVKYAFEL
ncbi:MAG: porin [Oceanococcaceae bacterium]